ncbi:AI-2E family transporter [Candidatus Pacearchaeota archaeon]|nr:MAG: AI-2E family transporter [Candidatus Pacearchaeota archaeon]
MSVSERDIRRLITFALVLLLGISAFLILKPVWKSVVGGLILAYIFFPIYKLCLRYVKYKNLAALIVSLLVLALLILPVWLFVPTLMREVFDMFQSFNEFNAGSAVAKMFPSASEAFRTQASVAFNAAISKLSSEILNFLVKFIIDFPILLLNLFLASFVFFFALRDADKLAKFAKGLLPVSRSHEKSLVKQFRDITNSVLYGQVVVGVVQGLFVGLAMYLFGVPKTLTLTLIAIVFGIMPVIGPSFVYIPVTIYLFFTKSLLASLGFLAFNLVLASLFENYWRAAIVAKRAAQSQVVVLISMLGGFLVFGFLGFIIGPLVAAYFITLVRAYKEGTLTRIFTREK